MNSSPAADADAAARCACTPERIRAIARSCRARSSILFDLAVTVPRPPAPATSYRPAGERSPPSSHEPSPLADCCAKRRRRGRSLPTSASRTRGPSNASPLPRAAVTRALLGLATIVAALRCFRPCPAVARRRVVVVTARPAELTGEASWRRSVRGVPTRCSPRTRSAAQLERCRIVRRSPTSAARSRDIREAGNDLPRDHARLPRARADTPFRPRLPAR